MERRFLFPPFVIFFLSWFLFFGSCTDLEELPPTAGPLLILSPSDTYGEYPFEVSFFVKAIPSRGSIKNLIIDFGDGTVEDIKDRLKGGEVIISHTYDRLGVFRVTLSALDGAGSSKISTSIITNDRPEIKEFSAYRDAEFLEPASDFLPGDLVYIRAMCRDPNGIDYVLINWGDGNFTETNDCKASHRYIDEGDFEITLIVFDSPKFAPYPLSSSARIKVSVFAEGGSVENIAPFISFRIEGMGPTGIQMSGTRAVGVSPFKIDVVVGVFDPDGGVKSTVVDWGDGSASVLKTPVSESGSRKIFRVSHTYEKEGSFFITVIAEDNNGKKSTQRFGPISVFRNSPAIYIEPRDTTGEDAAGKTFSAETTITTKIISYDADEVLNRIYVTVEYVGGTGREIFVGKVKDVSGLSIDYDTLEISADGSYKITYWILPEEISCGYCSTSPDPFNPSLEGRCKENQQFGGLSECETKIEKLRTSKIKSQRTFQVSIRK